MHLFLVRVFFLLYCRLNVESRCSYCNNLSPKRLWSLMDTWTRRWPNWRRKINESKATLECREDLRGASTGLLLWRSRNAAADVGVVGSRQWNTRAVVRCNGRGAHVRGLDAATDWIGLNWVGIFRELCGLYWTGLSPFCVFVGKLWPRFSISSTVGSTADAVCYKSMIYERLTVPVLPRLTSQH